MASLEDLARKKFLDPPLSGTEELVVRHASDGTMADCRELGGGDDPAKADGTPEAPGEKWPETRNVRADLIRWLFVDREARKQVDPRGVQIQGARVTGTLNLSFTNTSFPLGLWNCRLEQDLDLQEAKMPALSLEGSWTRAISAGGLELEGGILLRNGFHADGEVGLIGATIGGDLVADGGTFKSPKSDKNNATRTALRADGIKVARGVLLRNGFSAEGKVKLTGAEIAGRLEVIDAWVDELNLDSSNITGPFFWKFIRKDAHPGFPDKEWKPILSLINAKVGALLDDKASWPEKGRLHLDRFVYGSIGAAPTDATTRLKWLRLEREEYGYLPQPYEQLIAVLRRMGHEDQVAEIAIAKQLDLRGRGGLGRWGRFWSWFLYRTVRYGYEPWRAFVWIFLLIALGSCVFYFAHSVNVLVPSDKDAYADYENPKIKKVPAYYPDFHAPFYSLDVVLPFDLGQKSSWRLVERWPDDSAYWGYEFYSIVQLFAGWALLIVAAAVPAGLIKKD
jgi:hypothetical protein